MRLGTKLLARAGRALTPVSKGGRAPWWAASGGATDLRAEAGLKFDGSLGYSGLRFGCTHLAQARPRVRRRSGDGKGWDVVPNHPIEMLLTEPVDWQSGAEMAALRFACEFVAGTSYCFKHLTRGLKLLGLEQLPLGACKPVQLPGSAEPVDYYEIRSIGGRVIRALPIEILVTKWIVPNPLAPTYGLSPLDALLAEIAADETP